MKNGVAALEDLERKRHVGSARHPRQVALDLRVAIEPLLPVLVANFERLGSVRNHAAFNHARAAGHRAHCPEVHHFLGGHRTVRPRPERHCMPRGMCLKVVVGRVQRLPDSIQVGVAVGRARRPIRLRLSLFLSLSLARDGRDNGQQRQDSQAQTQRNHSAVFRHVCGSPSRGWLSVAGLCRRSRRSSSCSRGCGR